MDEQRARLIELSHVIEDGMITYPGLPGPRLSAHLSRADSRGKYAEGTEFEIGAITMVGNTGTYLDSPYHRYPDGADLSGLPLESVADLPISIVRLDGSSERGIEPQALAHLEIEGRAVLLQTGWDKHWATAAYGDPAPYLTEAGARFLIDAGVRLVGIDSVNIDDTVGDHRPAHTLLLGAAVPVLEHLTALHRVPTTGARLHAAPPLIAGFGTFPVRAYAIVR